MKFHFRQISDQKRGEMSLIPLLSHIPWIPILISTIARQGQPVSDLEMVHRSCDEDDASPHRRQLCRHFSLTLMSDDCLSPPSLTTYMFFGSSFHCHLTHRILPPPPRLESSSNRNVCVSISSSYVYFASPSIRMGTATRHLLRFMRC
ncbi:unnamed protein product [Cuscuta epithymum]|uniref:Uncharacterized protein n=1 Tax=Cuscuta epithymum TaxID=186058 RepID=A0AAV0DB42_9ASTE|nr:unnamed protein product [Cuscuta epithymum]